jgi:hypothetical protein
MLSANIGPYLLCYFGFGFRLGHSYQTGTKGTVARGAASPIPVHAGAGGMEWTGSKAPVSDVESHVRKTQVCAVSRGSSQAGPLSDIAGRPRAWRLAVPDIHLALYRHEAACSRYITRPSDHHAFPARLNRTSRLTHSGGPPFREAKGGDFTHCFKLGPWHWSKCAI